jgi:hypothetical protein
MVLRRENAFLINKHDALAERMGVLDGKVRGVSGDIAGLKREVRVLWDMDATMAPGGSQGVRSAGNSQRSVSAQAGVSGRVLSEEQQDAMRYVFGDLVREDERRERERVRDPFCHTRDTLPRKGCERNRRVDEILSSAWHWQCDFWTTSR